MWIQSKRSTDSEYYGFEPYRMVDVSNRCSGNAGYYAGVYIPSDNDIKLAKEVIEREQPIRFDVLCRRLSPIFNLSEQRITNELRRKTERLISRVSPKIVRLGDFVYLCNMKEIRVRYRTYDAYHERKTEDICHEEMMQALSNIGKSRFKITREELISCAVTAFGYLRTGTDLRRKLTEALNHMIKRGDVEDYERYLRFVCYEPYHMGDYSCKIKQPISKSSPSKISVSVITASQKAANSVHRYCSVGDIKDADKEGFINIYIKKAILDAFLTQKKCFTFKVSEGEKTYLFSIGAKKLHKAIKKDINLYTTADETLWGFALNVKNNSIWSINGNPRVKACDCGKSETKKRIPDSPEFLSKIEGSSIRNTVKQTIGNKVEKSKKNPVNVVSPTQITSPCKKENTPKKKIKTSAAFQIRIKCQRENARDYVSINSATFKRKTFCVFMASQQRLYYIKFDELLTLLKSRYMLPIVYKDSRGECWCFYMDALGRIYKNATDRLVIKELPLCELL